jgi:hypothetical protein
VQLVGFVIRKFVRIHGHKSIKKPKDLFSVFLILYPIIPYKTLSGVYPTDKS